MSLLNSNLSLLFSFIFPENKFFNFRNTCKNNLPLFLPFGVIFEAQEELNSLNIRKVCDGA